MKLYLGRKPACYTDKSIRRRLVMASALDALGTPPAASDDYVSAVTKATKSGWGMLGNDQWGDCVFADTGHIWMLRTANTGTIVIPTTAQVLALYSQFTGFNPNAGPSGNNSTDNGADELTTIGQLETLGFLGDTIEAGANIVPTNTAHRHWAVQLYGSCRWGINLPQSAMDAFNSPAADGTITWDYVAGSPCIGGHDVPEVQYMADGTSRIVSWGALVIVTPAFMAAKFSDGTPYLEECHAELATKDWFKLGVAPSKYNNAQLLADLQAVT